MKPSKKSKANKSSSSPGKGKKNKKKAEETIKQQKKRGRPSNAELVERAKVKRHEHDAVREQLLAAIETNIASVGTSISAHSPDQAAKPKYPVFFIGEDVCMGWWENLYEGYVVEDPDPTNGALARVKWDDGRISWHAKENLRSIHKARQRKVKRTIYGDQQRNTRNLEDTSSID